jgi:hypothetical protein
MRPGAVTIRSHGVSSAVWTRGQKSPPPSAARSIFVKYENRAALSSPLKGEEELNRYFVPAAGSVANALPLDDTIGFDGSAGTNRLLCSSSPSMALKGEELQRYSVPAAGSVASALPLEDTTGFDSSTGTRWRLCSSSPLRGEDSAARFSSFTKIDLAALGGGDFVQRVQPIATGFPRKAVGEDGKS